MVKSTVNHHVHNHLIGKSTILVGKSTIWLGKSTIYLKLPKGLIVILKPSTQAAPSAKGSHSIHALSLRPFKSLVPGDWSPEICQKTEEIAVGK